ncbi:MAG: hypothetical protein CBC45_002840 [Euryarchaeota archaeon TMED85]|nr:MAG: hypothetical protein CMA04_004370 [Euryarchaeota archaeon]RPG75295.1 MAG: hypothetical protein CBC45_002840 [Euryarchaeota archaeon TMED85]|tara:strand:- start:8394 stop:9494 length:1101 start_codon:yes stop_codon:yes gene_type:complete
MVAKPKSVLLSAEDGTWRWTSSGRIVTFYCEAGEFWWKMPKDFDAQKTHQDLYKVATFTLLSPWVDGILDNWEPSRVHGKYPGLSFSGGIDSTACYILMPQDTVLIHHRRSFKSLLKHNGADRLFKHIKKTTGRVVHSIPSNHEKIRKNWDKPNGFSTDLAAAVHLILLADHFDLRGIALGMPIDNTYLWHGHRKRDFSETGWWKKWAPLLSSIGLDLILPIAGVSEATAVHIVQKSGLGGVVSSCLRAKHPGCGRCWKCFHKNGMLGHPYDIQSREIQTFLNQRPVRTSTHAIWWVNEQDHWDQVPDLLHLKEVDFSWWTKHYPPAFSLLPSWIRSEIQSQIEEFTESIPDDSSFYTWDLFPDAP